MKYKNLEDYIATLSESEKEEYRHLIEEHRERDLSIKKNCDDSRKKLERLLRDMETFAKGMVSLKGALDDLNRAVFEVRWKMSKYPQTDTHSGQDGPHYYKDYPTSFN